jgi:hypothetical protein
MRSVRWPSGCLTTQRTSHGGSGPVGKRRRDLTLVDPFWHNRDVAYADIVWPADLDLRATNRRYGTDDFSGVAAAKIAAKEGSVYIIDQDDVNFGGLHEAGFRTVDVQGSLYELVAPTDGPSACRRGPV